MTMKGFGTIVKELREEQGLSRAVLGRRCHLSDTTIRYIETGVYVLKETIYNKLDMSLHFPTKMRFGSIKNAEVIPLMDGEDYTESAHSHFEMWLQGYQRKGTTEPDSRMATELMVLLDRYADPLKKIRSNRVKNLRRKRG